MLLNQNLNRNMKEARISFSCFANLSTCLLRYCSSLGNVGTKVNSVSQSQMTIQVLAAFCQDGFSNNKILQVNKLV